VKLIKVGGKANENLYRHPETGIIYFWMAKKGRGRVQKSTGTDVLSEARRIADEIKFEFLGQRNPRLGRKLVKELFPEWLETKQIRRPATFARYSLCWEHLQPFTDGLAPEDLNERWWESEYIPGKRRGDKDRRFFNDRKTVRGFLIAMRRDGLIDRVPTFINPDPKSTVGKVYSDAEIRKLRANASDDLGLQIDMALSMFMRKGEILLLALERIDRKNRLIRLGSVDTKTKKARTFAISKLCWPRIEAKLGHASGFLFPSNTGENRPIDRGGNQSAWEGCKRRAEVTGRFHDLRHTALTKAFRTEGANAALICHSAGLSLEEAERTYLHFQPEDTRSIVELVNWEAA
jgi:integrase